MSRMLTCALSVLIALLLAACAGAPELKEGERYFEGGIAFEYAENCTVSYILSADGRSVHNVNVTFKNMHYEDRYISSTHNLPVRENFTSKSMNFPDGTPDGQGYLELSTREATLRLNITPDGARGEMDYSYKSKAGDTPSIDMFIGTYPFTMQDKTDSFNAK